MSEYEHFLRLCAVTKRYESVAEGETGAEVLKGVDLQLAVGEAAAVVGPSGSGKSTLLNIIGTLDQPTSGSVELEGRDLSSLSEREQADLRNREIGFVFQSHHLLPQCTVKENVLVPTLAQGRGATEAATERATQLLERVELSDRLSHRPGQLSGGERQRVAVVRALINNPKLLLADEPTGSLDRAAARNLTQLLVELNAETGVTLVVVTHALEVAEQMPQVLELREGILLARGE